MAFDINNPFGTQNTFSFTPTTSQPTPIVSGGFLLPTINKAPAIQDPIYFASYPIAPNEEAQKAFNLVNNIQCKKMFYIQYAPPWRQENIYGLTLPVPTMTTYQYDSDTLEFNRCNFSQFTNAYRETPGTPISARLDDGVQAWMKVRLQAHEHADLVALYVQRLLLDGFIGFNHERGKPYDIDAFIYHNEEPAIIVDVKEKFLDSTRAFGMDISSFDTLLHFKKQTGLPVEYVVNQVDKSNREHIAWRNIELDVFAKFKDPLSVTGGAGLEPRGVSKPCYMCYHERFDELQTPEALIDAHIFPSMEI